MDSGLSHRERKKAQTRRRVMAAALRLFGERGFEGTTVESIAAAADIAPRTFFRYFPAKVDVLFADHDELVSLLRRTLTERRPGETLARAVRRATLVGVQRLLEDPSIYLTRSTLAESIPAASSRSRQLDADYEDVIAVAIAAERGVDPATDLHARVEARALWSASRAARQVWLATEGTADPRRLLNGAFDLVERGFASEDGEGSDQAGLSRSPGPPPRNSPRRS
jgi:TetR/AcrR family transcriptional regulator, regulator of mycofactocin system